MEDQRERSPETFLVNNFSFLLQIADLKQLPGLWKTKMVMYSISSRLKSAFSTIGKTTADKLTSKLAGKSSRFRFCVNN